MGTWQAAPAGMCLNEHSPARVREQKEPFDAHGAQRSCESCYTVGGSAAIPRPVTFAGGRSEIWPSGMAFSDGGNKSRMLPLPLIPLSTEGFSDGGNRLLILPLLLAPPSRRVHVISIRLDSSGLAMFKPWFAWPCKST